VVNNLRKKKVVAFEVICVTKLQIQTSDSTVQIPNTANE